MIDDLLLFFPTSSSSLDGEEEIGEVNEVGKEEEENKKKQSVTVQQLQQSSGQNEQKVINGEKETGVTTFFINKNIDEGDIIEINKIKITEDETAGSLHDKLKILGSNLVEKTVKNIFKKQIIKFFDTYIFCYF